MAPRQTQLDVVLGYMLANPGRANGITQLICTRIGGGTRLAAIVYTLRNRGWNVLGELIPTKNALGGVSHPAVYWLGNPQKGAGLERPRQLTMLGPEEDIVP